MPTAQGKLCAVYKRYVKYEEPEMEKNKKIAINVVDGFKRYLKDEEDIEVDMLVQGSAFEGIKVGRPDEFDFILTLEFSGVTPREARNVPGRDFSWGHRQSLAGYWQLNVSDPTTQSKFCSGDALSASKCKAKFQTYINRYTQRVRCGKYVQGIRHFDQGDASIGNPALKLEVSKAGGRTISIDMSICIKVKTGWVWRSECYYIAKEHSSQKSDTFWLVMNSPKELERFESMSIDVKTTYRIIKFLLQKQVDDNTYILKTAFLHLYDQHSNSQLSDAPTLLKKMNEYLRDHYQTGQLATFFNQSENLLDRYNPQYRANKAGYFRHLCNRDFEVVVDDLIEKAVPNHYERQQVEAEAVVEDQTDRWADVAVIAVAVSLSLLKLVFTRRNS